MKEKTLALIKPDAVSAKRIGEIISAIEYEGFKIVDLRMMRLPPETWREFYAEHKGRGFFDPMVEFMASGPVVAIVIESDHAIGVWRHILGATNPLDARPGTIRERYGDPEGPMFRNAAHGSDSAESAAREIALLFPEMKP